MVTSNVMCGWWDVSMVMCDRYEACGAELSSKERETLFDKHVAALLWCAPQKIRRTPAYCEPRATVMCMLYGLGQRGTIVHWA